MPNQSKELLNSSSKIQSGLFSLVLEINNIQAKLTKLIGDMRKEIEAMQEEILTFENWNKSICPEQSTASTSPSPQAQQMAPTMPTTPKEKSAKPEEILGKNVSTILNNVKNIIGTAESQKYAGKLDNAIYLSKELQQRQPNAQIASKQEAINETHTSRHVTINPMIKVRHYPAEGDITKKINRQIGDSNNLYFRIEIEEDSDSLQEQKSNLLSQRINSLNPDSFDSSSWDICPDACESGWKGPAWIIERV